MGRSRHRGLRRGRGSRLAAAGSRSGGEIVVTHAIAERVAILQRFALVPAQLVRMRFTV
jgi:hypothetical protein